MYYKVETPLFRSELLALEGEEFPIIRGALWGMDREARESPGEGVGMFVEPEFRGCVYRGPSGLAAIVEVVELFKKSSRSFGT
jgi:hypothetical protein